jgi:hypothetical protein
MALTRLQQGQVSGTLGDQFDDGVAVADLTASGKSLVDDLNALRSQIKRIQGTESWADALDGVQDLADIYAAMVVSGANASFQGDVQIASDLDVSGALEVSGAANFLSTMSGASDLDIGGDITLAGNLDSDVDENKTLFGSLSTGELTLGGGGLVVTAGDLQVDGNSIKSSTGDIALELSGTNVEVVGDLRITGNNIVDEYGSPIITLEIQENGLDSVEIENSLKVKGSTIYGFYGNMAGGRIDLEETYVAVKGDLQVSGGDIMSLGEVVAISLSGSNVEVAGDLTVSGNTISGADSQNLELGASGWVDVLGKLQISGNEIEASTGNTVLSFASDDVYVTNDLFVSGALEVSGNIHALAGMEIDGDLTLGGNLVADADENKEIFVAVETGTITIGGGGLTVLAGDLKVEGNSIQSSTGDVALELSGEDVAVAGNLTVQGDQIWSSTGHVMTMSGANATFESDVTVAGNLTVQGTVTTISTTNLEIEDAIIGFGFDAGVAVAAGDRGWVGGMTGSMNVVSFWDNDASRFKFARTNSTASDSVIVVEELADLELADLVASGTFVQGDAACTASGDFSHAQGSDVLASGDFSHAEGFETEASGEAAHAEGHASVASGNYSHAEGSGSLASGAYSHAEGYLSEASGSGSHAEGNLTLASGEFAHAEGSGSIASGDYAHAQGGATTAAGDYSMAAGFASNAIGAASFAAGIGTTALGDYSFAAGSGTIASGTNQAVFGTYNKTLNDSSLFVVGNGADAENRSDIFVVNEGVVMVGSAALGSEVFFYVGTQGAADVAKFDADIVATADLFLSGSGSVDGDMTVQGDLVATGTVSSVAGFTGSLTKLVDGSDFLLPGVGITLAIEDGAWRISSDAGSLAKDSISGTNAAINTTVGANYGVLTFGPLGMNLGTMSDANYKHIDVYLNGAYLTPGYDLIAVTTTTVKLEAGIVASLVASDVISVTVRGLV